MKGYIKRKIILTVILLIIIVTGIIYGVDITDKDESISEKSIEESISESEQQIVNTLVDALSNTGIEIYVQNIDSNKTGTLDNLEFIVDVTSFKIGDSDKCTYIIVGNTASEKLYSGEIEVATNDISDIKIGNTYKFEVEPLMSMTEIPRIIDIRHQEASEYDIIQLHKYREKVSTYKECMLRYESMTLDDIIIDSNNKYVTWTNTQIEEFLSFLYKSGYTDDYDLKSVVKIISIPGVIK